MSGFPNSIRDELKNKEFRDSYVAENTRRGLAYQIRALREARGWSQAELGRQAGKPQSNIYRWEDPTYGKFSVSTLIEIASIFDVALVVRFAGFKELLDSFADLRPQKLAVPSYEEEAADSEAASARQAMHRFSAMAAFFTPLEQSADRRSALSENMKGAITLPPLHRDASKDRFNALTAAAQ